MRWIYRRKKDSSAEARGQVIAKKGEKFMRQKFMHPVEIFENEFDPGPV